MPIHPAFLRLSAILPIGIALAAVLLFALEFDILAHGAPSKSTREKLELEEISLVGSLLTAALGLLALVNRRWMIREHVQRQLVEREATTDALTGLANRRQLLRLADDRLSRSTQRGEACAMLLIDLDRFKAVNDCYGHAAGDAVLVAVAQRLGHALPVDHVAGRLGGDEFAVVIGPACDLKLEACADQLATRICRPIAFGSRELSVGASIGMAVAPADGITAASLIAAADTRMYQRKRGGRRLELDAAA